ncbi:hypothetical protein [Candidatus Villigracilis affinis]|uniref:hypothetical protein n=1 Tax=Candidatus Villigracilis affinis TaxID=3140682 RepID=UPI002A220B71|nr:hypothetical protein [Anaerolineales bacterium]
MRGKLPDLDIAERIQHLQQAQQAFETAGYAERQTVALSNLAIAYMDLGLYPHSRRLQSEVVEMDRAMGAKAGVTYDLGNLIQPENLSVSSGGTTPARVCNARP